jgi:hypothetical protein
MNKEEMLSAVIQRFGFEHENTIWFAGQMTTASSDALAFMMDMLLDPPFEYEPTDEDLENMRLTQEGYI